VNSIRTERWLGVERTVCYVSKITSSGGLSINITGRYDRVTGVAFTFFIGVTGGSAGTVSIAGTIISASMISSIASRL
jgi:hypothetical protein